MRDNNEVFSSVLASSNLGDLRITMEESGTETARGRLVTENYFQTLGVEALLDARSRPAKTGFLGATPL